MTLELTIPTTWHAEPHALSSDLVNYFPRGIWLLIISYFEADQLIHALSDDKILALWVKQIELRVVKQYNYVEMIIPSGRHNPFNQPAYIEIYHSYRSERWYEYGKRHRIGGPAHIGISDDGRRTEIWYKDDKIHRIGGPAYYTITRAGQCSFEQWCIDGKRHRIGGPAEIQIYLDDLREEIWFENDKRHRIDEPAHIMIHPCDSRDEKWYENGVEIPR